MRIQLISDLHLEYEPAFMPQAAQDVDVLVLAGDIGSCHPRSALTESDFGLGRFSPRHPRAQWPRVLYIPGNHEFDSLDYDATYAKLKRICGDLGIEWLDRETITMGTVRFIGTVLWSDFEALARSQASATQRRKALEKAYRAADFYLSKNTTLKDGKPLFAEDMRELGKECQQWLRDALARPFEGKTVAATHFAPTLDSADPRYGLTPGTAGFCNALDDLLPLADVWMHGHLHCANDFTVSGVERGRPYSCRVISNPRGYYDKGEHDAFQERLVIEV